MLPLAHIQIAHALASPKASPISNKLVNMHKLHPLQTGKHSEQVIVCCDRGLNVTSAVVQGAHLLSVALHLPGERLFCLKAEQSLVFVKVKLSNFLYAFPANVINWIPLQGQTFRLHLYLVIRLVVQHFRVHTNCMHQHHLIFPHRSWSACISFVWCFVISLRPIVVGFFVVQPQSKNLNFLYAREVVKGCYQSYGEKPLKYSNEFYVLSPNKMLSQSYVLKKIMSNFD